MASVTKRCMFLHSHSSSTGCDPKEQIEFIASGTPSLIHPCAILSKNWSRDGVALSPRYSTSLQPIALRFTSSKTSFTWLLTIITCRSKTRRNPSLIHMMAVGHGKTSDKHSTSFAPSLLVQTACWKRICKRSVSCLLRQSRYYQGFQVPPMWSKGVLFKILVT